MVNRKEGHLDGECPAGHIPDVRKLGHDGTRRRSRCDNAEFLESTRFDDRSPANRPWESVLARSFQASRVDLKR
jgi:hypothetical protein